MLRRLLYSVLILIATARLLSAQDPLESERRTSLAIVPFTSSMLGEDIWLGKAIADVLTQQLATVPDYVLVERTRLNNFLDEMELQEDGFADEPGARRLGRVAKVDQVIYGNFARAGESLAIDLILVDLASQMPLQRHSVRGDLDRLHELVADLSTELIESRGRTLSGEELGRIHYRPTDSTSALRHFYEAFDHMDKGRPEDAFGAFYAAVERDADFHEAGLWMARTLQQLGHRELAAIAFQEVVDIAAGRVEGFDARLFLAELLEKLDRSRAIELYQSLITLEPKAPHSLEAAYRLANLLEKHGDLRGAFDALGQIDAYVAWVEEHKARFLAEQRQEHAPAGNTLSSFLHLARQFAGLAVETDGVEGPSLMYADRQGVRHSRFFSWDQALDLYREAAVRRALLHAKLPLDTQAAVPRGTFVVDPENPVISEPELGATPPLFHGRGHEFGAWKETIYAIVVPRGYVATGAELRVTGRMLRASTNHSFGMRLYPLPMPPNYHNAWIGALYGQTTDLTTLEKHVPFHGQHRRFLTLQLTENHSEIRGWELRLNLQPQEAAALPEPDARSQVSGEGRIVARLSNGERPHFGPTQPQYRYLLQPRRNLALADGGTRGLTLVAVRGEIGGRETDLWLSRSRDAVTWSEAERMPINAVSEDYAPQLLAAEDGSLRLFWLSDRRGRGWELWTSRTLRDDGKTWTAAQRLPIEPPTTADPLLYSAIQDRSGRWLVATHSAAQGRIVFLSSNDGDDWRRLETHIAGDVLVGLMLTQDTAGVYRLAGLDHTGALRLWRSTDFEVWTPRDVPRETLFRPRIGFNYAAYLFPEPGGQLLALLSDSIYGLQFARFDPEQGHPVRDLVPRLTVEAFAAAQAADGGYLVAVEEADGISIRHYRSFRPGDPSHAPLASPLYREMGEDGLGNRWTRIFAAARIILPDVTAVATQDDGRIWWGIETGIFSTHDDSLLFSDVSQGYPFHTTTEIEPCGSLVYLASRFSTTPRLGIGQVTELLGMSLLKAEELTLNTDGRITAIACGPDETLFIGTSSGDVLKLRGRSIVWRSGVTGQGGITAIAADPAGREIYVGTEGGGVYRLGEELEPLPPPARSGRPIQAMTVAPSGEIWAAVKDAGLFRFDGTLWRPLPHVGQAFPRFSVSALALDRDGGLWLLPDGEVTSLGLAYVEGSEISFFNPPQRRLAGPVDMSVGADGAVWIGTGDDGLYRFELGR